MPLILLPRPAGSRVKLDRMAAEAGLRLSVSHEVANVDVMKDFVERGLGLGVLPYSSVMPGVEEGRYRAVPIDGLTITRTLVRRADRPMTPAMTALARLVHDEIDRLIAAGGFGEAPPPQSAHHTLARKPVMPFADLMENVAEDREER